MKFAFQQKWILARRAESGHAFEPESRALPGRELLLKRTARQTCRVGRSVVDEPMGRAGNPQNAQGVALVITLILLAVITTLAIAFLALTYRETASVDSMGRTTDAELAADIALERAKAEILAPFPRHNSAPNANGSEIMGPDFLVSVNSPSFDDTNRLDPTNMFFNPSPPVFVDTNRAGTAGPLEDRFHLDLNRNNHFEETGFVPDTTDQRNGAGNFQIAIGPFGTNILNWRVGDPQWIGIPQRPGQPHGPNNRFIARYAFMVLPIGRSLDMNWIHNQAIELEMRAANGYNGYFRNQGVGSWELNLAAYLADLNTNYWAQNNNTIYYRFEPFNNVRTSVAVGPAFDDAREILRYRYSPRNFNGVPWDLSNPPASANASNDLRRSLVPNLGLLASINSIDTYADGPLGPLHSFEPLPSGLWDDPTLPWAGADSRRHYSSIHDFFDATKLPEPAGPGLVGFRKKLKDASSFGNSYDRYTFYRMLAQMGTDSAPEEEGKVDINYVNIRSWVTGSNYRLTAEDGVSWTNSTDQFVKDMGRPGPELFFLTVVTNLLVREPDLAFIVTNARPTFAARTNAFGIPLRIPIFTNGSTTTTNLPIPGPLYSGRLHQILQQAANIYDATRAGIEANEVPSPAGDFPRFYPTVFRPQFEDPNPPNGNVYITNFVRIEFYKDITSKSNRWHDLDMNEDPSDPTAVRISRPVLPDDLVYGIPLIVGARKGWPNFNEFAIRTTAEATRRLDFYRATPGAAIITNQTITLNVANDVAVEARNSYQRPLDRRLDLYFGIRTRSVITNNATRFPATNWITGYATGILARTWGGTRAGEAAQFRVSPALHQPVLNYTNVTTLDPGGVTNQWGLSLTNRMLFFLVDPGPPGDTNPDNDRIVDAVTLNGPRNYFDIAGEMGSELKGKEGRALGNIWSVTKDPNRGTSFGITHQITVSTSSGETSDREWTDYNADNRSKESAISSLVTFLNGSDTATNHVQAGFTPIRRMLQTNYFRVDDPLVHYTLEDLEPNRAVATLSPELFGTNYPPLALGTANPNSTPWGKGGATAAAPGTGALDPALIDPGVSESQSWDFPTNHFPNIGWLGRVHRGTPWQTIYLKSKAASDGDWHKHSGRSRSPQSAKIMHPTRDWRLLDIFTTAPYPNATRGRLSINQTNPAAWSAVLSGVVLNKGIDDPDWGVVTTLSSNANVVVAPAAFDTALFTIVEGINTARTNHAYGQFKRLGDLLAVPELTYKSPFLNSPVFNADAPNAQDLVFDFDYERIPQQILSLLKVGEPRFVVYAWGQSLKPAKTGPGGTGPSIDTGGDWKGLCRNYQITGELAVRAVVRVDFERDPNTELTDYRKPHAVVESYSIVPVE